MMLGLGEAGPWPGTTKSNAEWFPQKERALAQGLFGAAASLGSIFCTHHYTHAVYYTWMESLHL